MRLALALLALLLAIPHGSGAQDPDSIHVTGTVERQVQSAPVQALCVIRWAHRERAFDILDVTPAPDSAREMARCGGYPVMLVRPVCLVTVEEGQFYPASTPMLVLRCAPHAQAHRFRQIPFPVRQLERA